MKIALLCNGYGLVNRGAERYTEELYNLLKDDFDITIYGMKTTDISYGMYTKSRHTFKIPWRNGKAYLESYYFGKKWYEMYKNHRFDLVINNAGLGGSYWCSKYRKKTGTPFITLERGGGREEMINYLFKPDCMIFLTEVSRRTISKFCLPKVDTYTLPIGINICEFEKKSSKSEFTEGLEHPIFLSTSAMVGFKRIDLIISAIKNLGYGSLIQTSTGSEKNRIIEFGSKQLGDNFKYLGVVSRKELLELYHSCDVFVNASSKEAFGVVYLEAMASGLPIVTQNDEKRREIIGNCGVFVDCGNVEMFSRALGSASKINCVQLEQVEKYDWNKLKPQYISVIKKVCDI